MGITDVTTKRSILIYLCYLWRSNEEVYEDISVKSEPDEQETAPLHRCMVGVSCLCACQFLVALKIGVSSEDPSPATMTSSRPWDLKKSIR